jgi:hypothetical protein
MAISFVGSVTATGSNPTLFLNLGTVTDGAILVLVTTGGTLTTPDGFTRIYTQGAGRNLTVSIRYVAAKTYTLSDSLSLTLTGTNSRARVLAYDGAGNYNAIATVATGTGTTATTNTQTTTYANDRVLSIYATNSGSASTFTVPASTTSRGNNASTASVNGLLVVDELQAAAGTTTARSSTLSVSRDWAAVSVSFVENRTVYWVGGTGTWDISTVGNWANSSGGSTTGVVPPGGSENVIIDTSSGTGTITCTAGLCKDLTVTASQAIVLGAAASTLSVFGTISFPAGGSFSASTNANTITLASFASTNTITTNGKSFSSITFGGTYPNLARTYTLPSSFTATGTVVLNLATLTLSTNTTTLTCANFQSNNGLTRTINWGTGNITTTGSGNAFLVNINNLTYTGTPTLNVSNSGSTATTVNPGGDLDNINVTTGTYALTLTMATITNLNFTGFSGTWAPGATAYNIDGNVTLSSGMTYTAGTSVWTFNGGGTQTLTTNGKSLYAITQNQTSGGATLRLASGTTTLTNIYTLTDGALNLNTNTATLTCLRFVSNNSNSRAIQFGTGQINVTGNGSNVIEMLDMTNFTRTGTPVFNCTYAGSTGTRGISLGPSNDGGAGSTSANAVSINVTAGSDIISIKADDLVNLNFTGFTGTYNADTSYDFNVDYSGDITFSSGMTYTAPSAGDFRLTATSGVQTITSAGKTLPTINQQGAGGTVRLASGTTTVGSTRNYTLTAGTLDLGTNTSTLSTGQFNSSNSNARAIAFGTGNITTTGSGTVWDTATATNFSYTGTPTVNISNNSASSTTVRAHSTTGGTASNALNFNFTTGTYALTLTSGSVVDDINFTGFSGSWSPGTATATIYGNITLVSGMTYTAGTGVWTLAATSGTQTITSGGKTLGPITQNGVGGTVALGSAFVSNGTYTLTNGTLNANNQNFTALDFTSSNSNVRTITMGSGTWTLSGTNAFWTITTTNLTFNKDTANIVFSSTGTGSRTFNGGGLTYNNLTIGGATGISTLTITGANTFDTLASTKTVAHTITFPNVTTTVSNWTITGTPGNVVTCQRTGASGTWTIDKTGGGQITGINYLNISNSTATPSNTWYAGANSIDGGGNTGWIFGSISNGNYFLLF